MDFSLENPETFFSFLAMKCTEASHSA